MTRRGAGTGRQVGGIGAESVDAEQDGHDDEEEQEKRHDAPFDALAQFALLRSGLRHVELQFRPGDESPTRCFGVNWSRTPRSITLCSMQQFGVVRWCSKVRHSAMPLIRQAIVEKRKHLVSALVKARLPCQYTEHRAFWNAAVP